jgi:tRNA delta(2)-isopentenylpyrophosphate transferase
LVGGTGLYFKSLTDGLVKIPNISKKFRNKIRTLQSRIGQKEFYNRLIKIDSKAKAYAKPNDVQRSVRAYEIKKYTKLSILDWFKKTKKTFNEDEFIKIYLDVKREKLINIIIKRIEQMFIDKVINEVIRFNKIKIKKNKSANKIIGITEITSYLKGLYNLEETKEKILIKTRQYAKRQTTWSRGQMINWIKLDFFKKKKFLLKFNS